MAKKGTKIKDLARELRVTSRALIDRCRELEIGAQNSITKLNPRDEARLRENFSKVAEPDGKPANQ